VGFVLGLVDVWAEPAMNSARYGRMSLVLRAFPALKDERVLEWASWDGGLDALYIQDRFN
jgi:hypothetical protein